MNLAQRSRAYKAGKALLKRLDSAEQERDRSRQSARRHNGDRNDDFGGKQVYTCEVQAGADKRRASKRQRTQEVAIRKGGRNAGKNDKSQMTQFDDRRPYRRRLRSMLAAAPVARPTGL